MCARIPLPTVPKDLDIDNNDLLVSMNEKDIRSINGTRVADAILQLVPDVDTFRTAVRCIKLWAIRRGIYSNILGFLGGVAWAIMVARVCQLYPNACASTVASKVFGIMVNWQWPHPVRLCDDKEGPSLANLQSWDPKVREKIESHVEDTYCSIEEFHGSSTQDAHYHTCLSNNVRHTQHDQLHIQDCHWRM